jgi:hypothetical protein
MAGLRRKTSTSRMALWIGAIGLVAAAAATGMREGPWKGPSAGTASHTAGAVGSLAGSVPAPVTTDSSSALVTSVKERGRRSQPVESMAGRSGGTTPVATAYDDSDEPAPHDILRDVNERPLPQQAKAAQRYEGRRVSWALPFSSAISSGEPGRIDVAGHVGDPSSFVFVYCPVLLSEYPRLNTLRGGALLRMEGTIESVNRASILLRDCQLSFNSSGGV